MKQEFKARYILSDPQLLKERFFKVKYCGHDFHVVIDFLDHIECKIGLSHNSPLIAFSSGSHVFYKDFKVIGTFEVIK